MKFHEIVTLRYATKKFDGQIIPEEKIDQLLELIRLSASSVNLLPWKVKIVKDQATKELLLPASYNQAQITTCSHLLIFCAETKLHEKNKKLEKIMHQENIPEEQIKGFTGMIDGLLNSMSDKDMLIWAQKQTYIALGNAINGAKALGFDSCPMEGFNPVEYSRILKLPEHLVPTVICPIGYAATNDVKQNKVRFSREEQFF
ncbi:MAG: NAD(P)H-dependent oxidoreductase [Candidatus Woesearchaeota archaeon]|jgi:nitroreductase